MDNSADYDFQSKWQCLEDPKLVIEFTKENKYHLYRDKKLIFDFAYKIDKIKDNNYKSMLFVNDTNEKPAILNLETVNSERIRVFCWKHHKILAWAYEFNRTNDLNSFDSIMSKILKEPE